VECEFSSARECSELRPRQLRDREVVQLFRQHACCSLRSNGITPTSPCEVSAFERLFVLVQPLVSPNKRLVVLVALLRQAAGEEPATGICALSGTKMCHLRDALQLTGSHHTFSITRLADHSCRKRLDDQRGRHCGNVKSSSRRFSL
jgi:hypothetical protein